MMSRIVSCVAALTLPFLATPAAAQYVDPDTCSMANASCYQARKERDEKNEAAAQSAAAEAAHKEKLLRLPPLPVERNVLLGNWRVENGGQGGGVTGLGQGKGTDRNAMARELLTTLSNPCVLMFGRGITFAPSTYSIQALDGSVSRGSVDYRSTQKQVILAVTRNWRILSFEIEGPNRVVSALFGCALVRVGAPAVNSAANATSAPSNARAGASGPSAPPAAGAMPQVAAVAPAPPPTPSRPPPEVCRNTLLDKLGTVGVAQVRAMAKVRYTEPALEGKVPNTGNLRLDLRGSACGEDPRVKASLYDFDANGMLQSITYVWDRPPGPAPAPIFQERVTQLSRFHSLPPPQSPGRLQADTSLGRLIIEDMPERNLLLEAYKAKQ